MRAAARFRQGIPCRRRHNFKVIAAATAAAAGVGVALLAASSPRVASAASYVAFDLSAGSFPNNAASGASAGQQVGYGYDSNFPATYHAQLWNGGAGSPVDLNPTGFTLSRAEGVSNGTQVGSGSGTATSGQTHALLWTGSAASNVDLNPLVGFSMSHALGVAGNQQVGFGSGTATSNQSHALLWTGDATTKVDLNPGTFLTSQATGTNGTQQAGYGTRISDGATHALLWNGSPIGFSDLNPLNFSTSVANGVAANQQVGSGFGTATGGSQHALLWYGSAATKVDLNPMGFDESGANATNGSQQVGSGDGTATSFLEHALMWSGSAGSYQDLHLFLNSLGQFDTSTATGVDADGNIVGYAYDMNAVQHAILWQAVSEAIWLGGDGTWSDASKWSGATVPDKTSVHVKIDNANPATSNVLLDQNATVADIVCDSGDGLTIDAGRTLTLAGPATSVLRGALAINGGRLDIRAGKIVASAPVGTWNGTTYDGVSGMIRSGRNGGGWGGAGIVTSQSSATSGNFTTIGVATASQVKGIAPGETAMWGGHTVTGSETLVMYTYGGDANLDGKINVDDYGKIDSSAPLGIAGWFNGDFNYDGKINVDDYGIIDFNVGIQGAPFPTGSAAVSPGLSAVPEPATMTILLACGAPLLVRRRRR